MGTLKKGEHFGSGRSEGDCLVGGGFCGGPGGGWTGVYRVVVAFVSVGVGFIYVRDKNGVGVEFRGSVVDRLGKGGYSFLGFRLVKPP